MLGAISCLHVLAEGATIDLVVHDFSGEWQFLCAKDHSASGPEEFDIVGVDHLVAETPELARFLDSLPRGWMAERGRNGAWVRSPCG